jgi:arabinose-5-phosphate isomerase
VALLDARGFGPEDFASSHPGGALGRRLLTHVADVMRSGESVPSVPEAAALPAAILEITRKRMGMTAVVSSDGRVAGIFTDGDLRRLLEREGDIRRLGVAQVMSASPATIGPSALAAEAVKLMEDRRISQLLVVDADRRLLGAVHIHDLLAAKVV